MTGWLTGWKEITAYVGKHIDTCRRWRDRYGMPIHRDPGGGPVAIQEQLDTWLTEFSRLTSNKDHKNFVEYRNQASKTGK